MGEWLHPVDTDYAEGSRIVYPGLQGYVARGTEVWVGGIAGHRL